MGFSNGMDLQDFVPFQAIYALYMDSFIPLLAVISDIFPVISLEQGRAR